MLQCGRNEQTKPSSLKFWPNGRDHPIAFVHVNGKEEAQSVATVDGNEQSKSNKQEAAQAVSAFHYSTVVLVMSQTSVVSNGVADAYMFTETCLKGISLRLTSVRHISVSIMYQRRRLIRPTPLVISTKQVLKESCMTLQGSRGVLRSLESKLYRV